jgi:hypothetical protein
MCIMEKLHLYYNLYSHLYHRLNNVVYIIYSYINLNNIHLYS